VTDARPAALLSSPATIAASRIVEARLDAATNAAQRLDDPDDHDALHDFRVAVRRLRSALRAYRPWLGRSASRKIRSGLRDLGRATNLGRDAEVQANWVASVERNLPENARAGAARLVEWLRRRHQLATGELHDQLRHVAGKITERLEFCDRSGPEFTAAFAALLAQHAADAATCLAAVTRADQVENAHEARIAVKRLRYLLEPLADEIPQARPLLEKVEALQDLLGELHDSHVVAETLAEIKASRHTPRPTLTALAAENSKRREAVFADLQNAWLGAAPAAFFTQIQSLATRG